MRNAAAVVLLLFLSALGGHHQGQMKAQSPAAAARVTGNARVESLHVQGNVWMLAADSSNAAVQIGNDGVLVVDTLGEALADQMLAEIRRLAGDKPIRYIVNTHMHPDHTGGNEKVAAAGRSIVAGNFAFDIGPGAANFATIVSHENALNRMSAATGSRAIPTKAWPTDTFFNDQKDLYFNGEGIQLLHIPAAHTDGDVMVYFRGSDVLVAGDVFVTTTFPVVDDTAGGSVKGVLEGLNRIIDITIPRDKQEGGTYVVPGHGRVTDEADVVDYRDMVTILRDRIASAAGKGVTLEQAQAAELTSDYEGRYGRREGPWTTRQFVAAMYKAVEPSRQPAPKARPSGDARAKRAVEK